MELERSIERWAALSPKAVADGSPAQSMFCIEDAQKDIARLAAALETSESERAKLVALAEFQHDLMTHEQRQIVITEGLRRNGSPLHERRVAALLKLCDEQDLSTAARLALKECEP